MSSSFSRAKTSAAMNALFHLKPGMLVGLGSGTTALIFVKLLGNKIKEQAFDVKCVCTSKETFSEATSAGIPLIYNQSFIELDITFDGTDEFDTNKRLIKGKGGALLKEKIVAFSSKSLIILADDSKYSEKFGSLSPVPVEVQIFGWRSTRNNIESLIDEMGFTDCKIALRGAKDTNEELGYVTENGNYTLDLYLNEIGDPIALEKNLNKIPGVVENGLFLGLADKIIIGSEDGSVSTVE